MATVGPTAFACGEIGQGYACDQADRCPLKGLRRCQRASCPYSGENFAARSIYCRCLAGHRVPAGWGYSRAWGHFRFCVRCGIDPAQFAVGEALVR